MPCGRPGGGPGGIILGGPPGGPPLNGGGLTIIGGAPGGGPRKDCMQKLFCGYALYISNGKKFDVQASLHVLQTYQQAYIVQILTFVLLNLDIPCLCKQCRSRSIGFFRSQLIWICTVCH